MRKWIAVAVVLVAALFGILMFRAPGPSRPGARAQRGPRVHWPLDKRYTYALSWRAKTSGEVAPAQDGTSSQSLGFESAIDGEIALERAGAKVALSWTRIDKLSLRMEGHDAAPEQEPIKKSIVGQPAFLDIDDRGRILAIAFPPQMNPSVAAILRSVSLELRYTLPESDVTEWEARERDPLGEVQVRYRSGLRQLARETVSYSQLDAVPGTLANGTQELHGGGVIELDADGIPQSIEDTIGASFFRQGGTSPAIASSWSFTLHRTSEARGVTPGLALLAGKLQPQPIAGQVADPDREKRFDTRAAEGVTFDSLMLTFDRFENGAKHDRAFVVKAAAWLRLHPDQVPYMVAKFKSKDLTVRGRGLIMDVLAQTNTPVAQKAMRMALETPEARTKPKDFSTLVQRFTFVNAPDKESVEFLSREYFDDLHAGNVTAAQGSIVALGSLVRRLDDQLEHDQARAVNERIRAELHNARAPEIRAALVAALGNAARDEDVADLAQAASDDDVRVRDQVATALRSVDSPAARSALLTLAGDSTGAVAIHAMDSLQKQTLGDDDWRALASLAREGKTTGASDAAFVALVREKGPARQEGREILTKLLKRNQGGDNDLPVIIRSVLQSSQGG